MAVPLPSHDYRTQLRRVVDGDTCVLDIDLGCGVTITRTVRLLGVNTPEVVGATATAGKEAAAFAKLWFGAAGAAGPAGSPLVVHTELDRGDKYGRLLGTIYRLVDGETLNAALLATGHAVAYDGGRRD